MNRSVRSALLFLRKIKRSAAMLFYILGAFLMNVFKLNDRVIIDGTKNDQPDGSKEHKSKNEREQYNAASHAAT